MINTFEEKLAYEIGVKLAKQAYLEKEASWQAAKTLAGGLKGVVTGQGSSVSKAFQQGAKGVEGAGATNFKGVMGEIGQGLKAPWQNMYKTYGARQGVKSMNAATSEHAAAQKAYQAAMKGTDTAAQQAAKATVDAAGKNIGKVGNRYGVGFGASSNPAWKQLQATAGRSYIPRTAEGAVNWGQVGAMGTGVGLAGAGAGLGYAALRGGNTYNTNKYTTNVTKTTPQVAPHEYYMNQFSNWMK